ncbi:MAG TPA: flavodoxin [Burkholderiaceae bacterium]
MKILVTYFSRSGYTQRAAEKLAKALDAQIAPIEEARPRDGVSGYVRSLFEALRGRDATIRAMRKEPADFDLVLIGTPVWASHASSPARAFARMYGPKIKRSALFCTMGGRGAEPALEELARLVGSPPVATLALTDRELDAGRGADKLARFARALRAETAVS